MEAKKTVYNQVKDQFNQICSDLPSIKLLTPPRGKAIDNRIKDCGSLDELIKVFKSVHESDFLNARNGKSFKASFDWIMKPSNFIKIIEGNYANKNTGAGVQDSVQTTTRTYQGQF